MTRYIVAVCAGVLFVFTGHPSGLRLLAGLAATNLLLHIWGRVRPEVEEA